MRKTAFLFSVAVLIVGFVFVLPAAACRCGDGIFDPDALECDTFDGGTTTEECDDGNIIDGDGCSSYCKNEVDPFCGDGNLDAGEECDDGNNLDGDGCSANCEIENPFCGDGNLDADEECDDGNNIDGDGCASNCTIEPFCGDGYLDFGEECDDGNVLDGDGCSANCTLEEVGQGCTPGYWKQPHHFGSWMYYLPTDMFGSVFENAFPGMTLLDVLEQGGGGLNALGRHTVAALLNAASLDVGYDRAEGQVIDMFNNVFPGTKGRYNGVKNILAGFNEQGCPLGRAE